MRPPPLADGRGAGDRTGRPPSATELVYKVAVVGDRAGAEAGRHAAREHVLNPRTNTGDLRSNRHRLLRLVRRAHRCVQCSVLTAVDELPSTAAAYCATGNGRPAKCDLPFEGCARERVTDVPRVMAVGPRPVVFRLPSVLCPAEGPLGAPPSRTDSCVMWSLRGAQISVGLAGRRADPTALSFASSGPTGHCAVSSAA